MKKRFTAFCFSIAMLLASVPLQVFAEDMIAIDEINFPDANFRTYVTSSFDADKDGYLSETEIAGATKIVCERKSISSLVGIEYFVAAKELYCGNNNLTELDVSKLTELTKLSCGTNPLGELDVSNLTALQSLYCTYNDLTELDVKNNTALTTLNCGFNKIAELDITDNTALTWFSCSSNNLTELDVTNNTALTTFSCGTNNLTELDVTKNTALTSLTCSSNNLIGLDVTNNTALTELYCNSNALTELDVQNNTALEKLYCYSNNIKKLDVSDLAELTELQCGCDTLTKLDVTGCTALTSLSCDLSALTELDVSDCAVLKTLSCNWNDLTSLDVSNNSALKTLGCALNEYDIYLTGNTFDLTTLPGNFDVSKASGWTNGTVEGNILTVNEGAEKVTYSYDCGSSKSATFTLIIAGSAPSAPSGTPVSGSVSSYAPENVDAKIELWQGTTKIAESIGTAYNFEGVQGEDYTLKLTVSNDNACKVGYLNGGSYSAIDAVKNADGSYSFTLPEGVEGVALVVNGDINLDGDLLSGDYSRLNAYLLGKISLSDIASFAADCNGDGEVLSGDYSRLNAVLLGKTSMNW